jgi:mRNA interferase RelE/StbE
MRYRLEISGKAKKDIESLDSVIQRRIVKKLKFFLAQDDPLTFAKRLVDSKDGGYRWRVGHYRVIFDVNDDVILLLSVQHRGQVYKP